MTMHPEARAWVEACLTRIPAPRSVIEIGSRNINGGVRDLFGDADYLGVDLMEGPGVDLVADAAQVDLPAADLVVTTEALEHYPDPKAVIDAVYRALVPGGALIATMAGPGRHPHSGLDGGGLHRDEHYRNIEPAELTEWLAGWAEHAIDIAGADLRCWATKRGHHG